MDEKIIVISCKIFEKIKGKIKESIAANSISNEIEESAILFIVILLHSHYSKIHGIDTSLPEKTYA